MVFRIVYISNAKIQTPHTILPNVGFIIHLVLEIPYVPFNPKSSMPLHVLLPATTSLPSWTSGIGK